MASSKQQQQQQQQLQQQDHGPHILIIPFPAQGHLLPLLDFAHLLSLRFHLPITVAVTTLNLPLLSPLLSSSPTVHPLVLELPKYPSLPPNVENAKDIPPSTSSFAFLIHALSFVSPQILSWAHQTPLPPTLIVSDFFCGWTQPLARDLRVPRITFSPSGALTLCISNYLWDKMPTFTDTLRFDTLPNSPTYEWGQLSSLYRSYVAGDPLSEFLKNSFRANQDSWGFVYNTFEDLERVYLEHLKTELGHPRVWAVGPLNLVGAKRGEENAFHNSVAAAAVKNLMAWLDGQEEGSVVYVCFGSLAVLSEEQVVALAAGLERSGARFVWSFRGPAGIPDAGFEARTEKRGKLIRGWAPQVEILSHPAVGAFLTHCGWNSVLEGISAGMAMLLWPMGADQFYNARLLEEEVRVGVRVCQGRETVPDSDKVARVVAESVSGSREERARAKELQRKALAAVSEGGSSYRDVGELVEMLNKEITA